jgi:hypothetical protein
VWAKILGILLLGAAPFGLLAANKPSEAGLRQAIRDKGKDLQARGATAPAVLIDDPALRRSVHLPRPLLYFRNHVHRR